MAKLYTRLKIKVIVVIRGLRLTLLVLVILVVSSERLEAFILLSMIFIIIQRLIVMIRR